MRYLRTLVEILTSSVVWAGAALAQPQPPACIEPISYLPLDASRVGGDAQGLPALGTYERISPDGRFILRSYSGAMLGKVSLMELPFSGPGPIQNYRTPFSNEAFPVQGSWRYLVDVNGEHYRFAEVLKQQQQAKPLFTGGMTGFYAAASEMSAQRAKANPDDAAPGASDIFIRSLSWPQGPSADDQGVGPLQIALLRIRDDGVRAQVIERGRPEFVCTERRRHDGSVFALPMISIDGSEFSAIPQAPARGAPSMRVYGLSPAPSHQEHPCDSRADLGFSPGKAVFGYPPADGGPAALTYSDLGHVYVYDRALGQTFRMDHAHSRVLASAFPGLTRDGRVIYGANWRDCTPGPCRDQAGYVVVDPYQSQSWRAYWAGRQQPPPRACITQADVRREREAFARQHGLPTP